MCRTRVPERKHLGRIVSSLFWVRATPLSPSISEEIVRSVAQGLIFFCKGRARGRWGRLGKDGHAFLFDDNDIITKQTSATCRE